MNRKERRAQKALRKKSAVSIPPEVAIHEAGHALAHYITADEMGISARESIERIDIHFVPTGLGSSFDGAASLSSQATTYGPMFSAEIAAHQSDVMEEFSLMGRQSIQGEEAGKVLTEVVSRAKANGADIDRWLKATALITVFGAVAEGIARGVPPRVIFDGYECEGDMHDFVRNAALANVGEGEIQTLLDDAFARAGSILQEQRYCDALNALGAVLQNHGSIPGARAVAVIEKALNE